MKKTWLFLTFAVFACLLIAYVPVGETLGLLTAESDKATNVIKLSDDFDNVGQQQLKQTQSTIPKAALSEEPESADTEHPVAEPAKQADGEPSSESAKQPEGEPVQAAEQPATESTETPKQEAEKQPVTVSTETLERKAEKQPVTKSRKTPGQDNARDNANGEDAEPTDEPTG